MITICLNCKKEFKDKPGRILSGRTKYCCRLCKDQSLLGKPSWNKGTKGIMKLNSTSFKKGNVLSDDWYKIMKEKTPWNKGKKSGTPAWNKGLRGFMRGEQSPVWKGDNVSYSGLHYWVYRELGRPKKCEICLTEDAKRFEWANKSGQYKRELTDWIRLCTKCHRKYDAMDIKMIQTRRSNHAR